MDRRDELKQQYKHVEVQAGVFQIRNLRNGKIFLKATLNLTTINGQLFQLNANSHRNTLLQQEWNTFGQDAFVVEILETLSQQELTSLRAKDILRHLEEKWLNTLSPYGEHGYHRPPAA